MNTFPIGHTLVAIDPSLRGTGVALFVEGMLLEVELVRTTLRMKPGNANLGSLVTSLLTEARIRIPAPPDGATPIHDVVMELPQVYPPVVGVKQPDPNDLIAITCAGSTLAGYYLVSGVGELTTVLPKTWKGQVPKDIHNRRTMGRLGAKERWLVENCMCPPSLLNNCIDAVGLGLWFLERR